MLILTRKLGESIQIGSNINVKVTYIGGGRVRIGIEAPRDISIRRAELPPEYLSRLPTSPLDLPAAG